MIRALKTAIAVAFFVTVTVDAATAPCPAAKPLGAHLEFRIARTEPRFSRNSRIRVWFELVPSPYVAPKYKIISTWSAKEMIWRTTAAACSDTPDYGDCRCPASRASGTTDLSSGYATYDPSGPDLSVMFPRVIGDSGNVRVQCFDRGKLASEMGAELYLPDTFAIRPRGSDPDGVLIADASGCYDAPGRVSEECAKQPDRFAVIPFEGSGELPHDSGPENVRWEICCGCGIPPREGLEGETDRCSDSAQQRGLFEVAINMAKALRADLRPRVDRFKNEKHLAEQYRSDFELVSNSCAGWDISIELLKALLGGTNAPESAKTLVQIVDIIEKLIDEDPSILLNVVEALPLPDFPEFAFLGTEFSMTDLWDGAAEAYEGALEVSQAGSIPQMKQRLEDCSDVPLVSNLVYDDAKLHLRHLEAAVRELPAIQELTTRIDQADTEVYNRWVAYHSACLEEAECRGTDPVRCGPAPP